MNTATIPVRAPTGSHEAIQKSLAPPRSLDDQDDSDETAGYPILDRLPARRDKRQVRGVLAILDQLDREGSTR